MTGGVSVREEKTKRKNKSKNETVGTKKERKKHKTNRTKQKTAEFCIRSGNYSECLGFVAGNADYSAILSRRPEVAWPVMGSQTSDLTDPTYENAQRH